MQNNCMFECWRLQWHNKKEANKNLFFLSITIGIGTVLVRETSSLSDILIATFLEARSKNYFFYICNINSVCFVIDFWWRRCCIFIWINRGYNTVTWIYPLFNFFLIEMLKKFLEHVKVWNQIFSCKEILKQSIQ